jgi:hypothetical protein
MRRHPGHYSPHTTLYGMHFRAQGGPLPFPPPLTAERASLAARGAVFGTGRTHPLWHALVHTGRARAAAKQLLYASAIYAYQHMPALLPALLLLKHS